jgi:hypothetical protein
MGQAVPPISVTCSKLYVRKPPLFSGLSLWTWVRSVTDGLLSKLASWKLWCPLSLCLSSPATFLRAHLGFEGWCFHLLVTGQTAPLDLVDPAEGASLLASQGGEFQLHKETWKGSGTSLGALLIRLIRTRVQIEACLRRKKGSLLNSQKAPE